MTKVYLFKGERDKTFYDGKKFNGKDFDLVCTEWNG